MYLRLAERVNMFTKATRRMILRRHYPTRDGTRRFGRYPESARPSFRRKSKHRPRMTYELTRWYMHSNWMRSRTRQTPPPSPCASSTAATTLTMHLADSEYCINSACICFHMHVRVCMYNLRRLASKPIGLHSFTWISRHADNSNRHRSS